MRICPYLALFNACYWITWLRIVSVLIQWSLSEWGGCLFWDLSVRLKRVLVWSGFTSWICKASLYLRLLHAAALCRKCKWAIYTAQFVAFTASVLPQWLWLFWKWVDSSSCAFAAPWGSQGRWSKWPWYSGQERWWGQEEQQGWL